MRKILAILTLCTACNAATWNSDGSASSVQGLHDASGTVSGDTITLPAGSFNWSAAVTITKAINLIGAGTTATGGGDVTTVVDNYASGSPLLNFYGTRLSGITFQKGTGISKANDGVIVFGGTRIDHCTFVRLGTRYIKVTSKGVCDSCTFTMTNQEGAFMFRNATTSDDAEWASPTAFGSSDYFYVEDCYFNNTGTGEAYTAGITDGDSGSKFVIRFNTAVATVLSDAHSTGHAGDNRGVRSREIYGNSVTSPLVYDPNYAAVNLISGTCLVWGNSIDQVYKNLYLFIVTRKDNSTYTQQATPTGWGYAGTQFNGTGSNWDGGTYNGTDAVYGYPTVDQVGRGVGDLLTGAFPSKINSTTGTIAWPNQALEPVYFWQNAGTIVAGWGGSEYANSAGTQRVSANRDYYPQATGVQTTASSPFNGTTGTGWGTLANRPTTCTTGVGYWATDQGSWNQSTSNSYGVQQNGADGVLYVATATNTWTAYYTPYTYPHPLRTDGGGGGSTGLTVGTLSVGTLNL